MASAAERTAQPPRAGAVALVLVAGLALVPAAPADASVRRVCATAVSVRDSPGGFTVGYLFRGDRVRIRQHSANRRSSRVSTPTEIAGWIPTRALCR